MSDKDFCEHCDLPKSMCIHGIPLDRLNPPTDALIKTGPTIEAQYGGAPCVGCGRPVQVGDSITMSDEGWAHTSEVSGPKGNSPHIFEED